MIFHEALCRVQQNFHGHIILVVLVTLTCLQVYRWTCFSLNVLYFPGDFSSVLDGCIIGTNEKDYFVM